MKNIYIVLMLSLFISFSGASFAQELPFGQVENCDEFTASEFIHTVDRETFPENWDWRDASEENWTVYMPIDDQIQFVSKPLPSPFANANTFGQLNVSHLQNGFTPDFDPLDGWELVFREFGGPSFAQAAPFPTFVLYNRYNSIMRVFVWAEYDREGYSEAGLTTRFREANEKGSALLGFVENPTSALDEFDVNIEVATPNEWTVGENIGNWLFAEMPVVYDPCTCDESLNSEGMLTPNISEVEVIGQLIQTQTIVEDNPNTGGSQTLSGKDGLNTSYNSGSKLVTNAGKFFKSTLDLLAATDDLDKGNSTTINVYNMPNNRGNINVNNPSSAETRSLDKHKMPTWLKAVPKVGPIISLMDALFSGGKKTTGGNAVKDGSTTRSAFSGDITFEVQTQSVSFYTPGTDLSSLTSPNLKRIPIYDHILGIFNLIEKPVMEYVTYSPIDNADYSTVDDPLIYQYRLKSPPSYAVNPASELELIDLKYAINYKLGPSSGGLQVDTLHCTGGSMHLFGPVALGDPLGSEFDSLSYVDRLRHYGLDIVSWPKTGEHLDSIVYTTGFFPASCAQNQSIMLAIPDANHPIWGVYNYTPTITLKVRAILRRTDADADANTEDVIFMATYPVSQEEVQSSPVGTYQLTPKTQVDFGAAVYNSTYCNLASTTNPPFSNTYMREFSVGNIKANGQNTPFFSFGNSGVPYDIVVENTTIDEDVIALNSITIANSAFASPGSTYTPPYPGAQQVTAPGPAIQIRAGNSVDIIPGVLSSTGSANAEVTIGLPIDHFQGCELAPMPGPASRDLIADICRDKNRYNPVIATRVGNTDVNNSNMLKAFPNPSRDVFNIAYQSESYSTISGEVYDMAGRVILKLSAKEIENGATNSFSISLANQPDGIYTLILRVDGQTQSVKLVKSGR